MTSPGRIDPVEVVALGTVLTTTWIFLPLVSILVRMNHAAAWMAVIAGAITVYLGYLALMALIKKFPGEGLLDVTINLAGPLFGRVMVVTYAVLFLTIAAAETRVFSEGIASSILPRTPLSVHVMVFIAAVVFANYAGIEAIARLTWLLFPTFLISLAILVLFNLNNFVLTGLFPLFGGGVKGLAEGAFQVAGVMAQIVAIPILLPTLRMQSTARRDGVVALVLSTMVGVLVTVTTVMAFPGGEADRRLFPLFELSLLVQIGTFFSRLEVVFVFFWFFAATLMFSIAFFLANLCLTRAFGLPGARPIVPILAVFLYATSFIPANIIQALFIKTNYLRPIGFAVIAVFPVVLWLLYLLRGGARFAAKHQAQGTPKGVA